MFAMIVHETSGEVKTLMLTAEIAAVAERNYERDLDFGPSLELDWLATMLESFTGKVIPNHNRITSLGRDDFFRACKLDGWRFLTADELRDFRDTAAY